MASQGNEEMESNKLLFYKIRTFKTNLNINEQ